MGASRIYRRPIVLDVVEKIADVVHETVGKECNMMDEGDKMVDIEDKMGAVTFRVESYNF